MFRFSIRDVLIYVTGFCIAIAAIAALPVQYFLLPVGVMTTVFLIMGQRKAAFAFASWFVVAWLISMVTKAVGSA